MKAKLSLILTLLIAASPVSAEVLATMQNNAGGKIVLTGVAPKACEGNYAAYSTGPKNETLWGCWFADGEFVHITWVHLKTTRSYPVGDFTLSAAPVTKT